MNKETDLRKLLTLFDSFDIDYEVEVTSGTPPEHFDLSESKQFR